ncbi:MAG: glycosyltransferase family 4 protein, partial [Actinomycetota bacterium]|nr:glycosyltransferase family 4 protein [Actinomycetota bacterium]
MAPARDVIRVAHISTVDLTLRFLLLPELLRLGEEGFAVTAISAPGPWVEQLEAAGIRHLSWRHATRAWDPRADVQAFRELLAILRRERFDLVHTHTPKAAFLGRIAARRAGVPCVVNTVHGFYAQPDDRPAKKLAVLGLERVAARSSDLELYQSAEDLDWARRLRIGDSARRVHVGGGIDVTEFDPERVGPDQRAALKSELGIREDAVVVGTVSRLVAEKGVRELLQVASALGSDDVRFLVVGPAEPGKPDAIGANEIARAAAEGVVFTGVREDTRDLYAAMDVFVLASWREGLPNVAIEALAMGKPLVLTDIRGSREVARDGIEALFVPPRD